MVETRVLVSLVLSFVFVNCAVLSGQEFYCRDPDTGKLYPVNATWSSSSFCGNYTCKIRLRNKIQTEYTPIRQLNVTNVHSHNADKNNTVTIEKKNETDILPLLHKKKVSEPRNMISTNADKSQHKNYDIVPKTIQEEEQTYKPKSHNCKNKSENTKLPTKSDRYLTENEIDSIADLLHTVKKSDLEAIVDIYNLAQDIYKEIDQATDKEMDQATDKDIVNAAINLIKEEDKLKNNELKPTSYWYNTLGQKGKIGGKYDMDLQGTRNVHSTLKPKSNAATYINGALLSRENYAKIPYYYPVTQFQRISSYTYPASKPTTVTRKNNTEVAKKQLYQPINDNIKHPHPELQQLIKPSFLLPYPFANIHHYNFPDSNSFYSKNLQPLDYYSRYKYYPYFNGYLTPIPEAILVNPHLSGEVQDVEQKPVRYGKNEELLNEHHGKNKDSPSWKTNPLSIEVLKDIRANVDTSRLVRAFPLRKNIKLERVGKLINLNDLNSQPKRSKRSTDTESAEENKSSDLEEYETYLVRVTCTDQTVPGYFRVGNMSQPYPNCCPQMINVRYT